MALGSTQPQAEMGIMNISWTEKVTDAQGWQLTTFMSSWNPLGLRKACRGVALLKKCHPCCVYQNYSRSKIREVAVKNTTIFV